MPRDVVVLFGKEEGKRLINKHCRRISLPVADLRRLVEEVVERDSMGRRAGLRVAFDEVLDNQDSDGAG
jgi:hypothetical protein